MSRSDFGSKWQDCWLYADEDENYCGNYGECEEKHYTGRYTYCQFHCGKDAANGQELVCEVYISNAQYFNEVPDHQKVELLEAAPKKITKETGVNNEVVEEVGTMKDEEGMDVTVLVVTLVICALLLACCCFFVYHFNQADKIDVAPQAQQSNV